MPGIVAARSNSIKSSNSAASGRGSQWVSRASRREIEGPSGLFVVGRRGAVARQAPEQPARDAVGDLRQQVAIEIVTVGRPDTLRQPDARVVDAHARRSQPGRDAREQRRRI